MNILGLDLYTWTLLLLALVVSPILGRREFSSLHRHIAEGRTEKRMEAYDSTWRWQWGITTAFVAGWMLLGRGLAEIGLTFEPARWELLVIGLAAAPVVALVVYSSRIASNPEQLDRTREQLGTLAAVAPHSAAEMRRFTWVSITAGICEEVLYRGLLLTSLAAAFGTWPAAVLSSVVFGIGHSYQGVAGGIKTAVIGLVMAVVVVTSGSLFAAILLHIVLDITQGRILHAAVNSGGEIVSTEPSPA